MESDKGKDMSRMTALLKEEAVANTAFCSLVISAPLCRNKTVQFAEVMRGTETRLKPRDGTKRQFFKVMFLCLPDTRTSPIPSDCKTDLFAVCTEQT